MKKLFIKVAIIIAGCTEIANAQQDPQFTQWMFNKLIYNPGYAGTSGGMCGTVQFRKQWMGFDGSPTSINFAGDMKLTNIPLGVGLTFINDKIGPMSTNFIRGAASWVTPVGPPGAQLGIGIDVGVLQKSINGNWITPEDKPDPTIPGAYPTGSNPTLNKLTYDLGFGAYYQIPNKFYIGLSSTHLPAQTVKGQDKIQYEMTRHFYVMTGYTFPIDPRNSITPNIKYKSDLAAGALDINLMYAFEMNNQKIWVGPTYRLSDAAAILAGYSKRLNNGTTTVKGGVSYDFVLSKLKGNTSGSFELFLGVCHVPKIKKAMTIETDRYY